ncbi:hypothetical protein ACWGCI_33615, partial [Streptomyces sp. NPDC054949]
LALIFGTLLSSQGTDASFVPVSRPSGRFLRFQLYQIISAPCFSKVAVGLDLNSVAVGGLCLSALHHVSAFPLGLIIGPSDSNSGMPKSSPPGVVVV